MLLGSPVDKSWKRIFLRRIHGHKRWFLPHGTCRLFLAVAPFSSSDCSLAWPQSHPTIKKRRFQIHQKQPSRRLNSGKAAGDTHISLRIICWHIEVRDNHICNFNNPNIKPLVLFLYNWFHWGWLRVLLLWNTWHMSVSLMCSSAIQMFSRKAEAHLSLDAVGHFC